MTVIYRLIDRDFNTLYIGQTRQPARRLATHRREQPWGDEIWDLVRIAVVYDAYRTLANEVEHLAIKTYNPRYCGPLVRKAANTRRVAS